MGERSERLAFILHLLYSITVSRHIDYKIGTNIISTCIQQVLVSLLNVGVLPVDKDISENIIIDNTGFVQIDNWSILSSYPIKSISEVITFIKNLKQNVDQKVEWSWNYLGNELERKYYHERLHELFWNIQDRTDIPILHEPSTLESPHLLLEVLPLFPDVIPPFGYETLGSKSKEFFDSLTAELPSTFYFDPYLVTDKESSFFWKMSCDNFNTIGSITKNNNILFHNVYTN
jgi:hypothetical protein